MELTISYEQIEERAKKIEELWKSKGDPAPQATVDFLGDVLSVLYHIEQCESKFYEAVNTLMASYEVDDIDVDDDPAVVDVPAVE